LALSETVSTLEGRIHEYFITTIKIFSNLMDLRSPKLLLHSKNVALLSSQVAKLMGLSEEEVQEIYISGLLHDIGKIGFSDRLLRTSSHDLPHSDFEIYRKHSIFGASCLKNLDRMKGIAANIRSHHEHLDGEGFPDGLKGAQIPLGAQILGVVETYFELMEGELTGSTMTSMQAIKALYTQGETSFDRKILDQFLIAAKKMAASIEQQINSAQALGTRAPASPANSSPQISAPAASPKDSSDPGSEPSQSSQPEKKSTYRPGRGEDPLQKTFTYKVLDALVNTYAGAKIDDRRDEKNGFLWVYSGSKRSEDNQKLDDWLTKNGFIYDNKLSGWYYPFD
jgi:putative nucleotidyltransferase with HDIG domain